MTTWNEFAVPQSSFERPVPLVLIDPDDNPNYTVCFRSEWLPYVLGALQQLTLQTTWKSDDKETVQQQQARARLLIEQFMVGCPTPMPSEGCIAFPMSASFISYYPQNPYTQPTYIPDWYSAVPLIVAEGSVVTDLLGLADGDVVALPGSFPNLDAIAEKGLTAIHLDLVGQGQVELHMVMFPEGSIAVITIDGDLLGSTDVDVNADIIELPGETPGEIIKEFNFETGGEHTIDIRFSPVLDDSGIPLRYGGGMRSVVLCGFDSVAGDTMFDVRQNEESPCALEKSTDGGTTWTQWANLKLCPPDLRMDRGNVQIKIGGIWINLTGGIDGTYDERQDGPYDPPYPTGTVPSGQTGNCLAAENITAYFASSLTAIRPGIDAAFVISIIETTVLGLLSPFITPLPVIASAIGLTALGMGAAGIDDLLSGGTLDTLKCALSCNLEDDGSCTADDYNRVRDYITTNVSTGPKRDIILSWLDGFGPVGLSRQGKAAAITTGDCSACECIEDWVYQWDFTEGTGGFSIGEGQYVAGVGYRNNTAVTNRWTTDIYKEMTSDQPITQFDMDYNSTLGCGGDCFRGAYVGSSFFDTDSFSTGDYTLGVHDISVTSGEWHFQNSNLSAQEGAIVNTIKRIRAHGHSVRPTTLTGGAFI